MLGVLVKQVQGRYSYHFSTIMLMVQNILAPAKFDKTEFLWSDFLFGCNLDATN